MRCDYLRVRSCVTFCPIIFFVLVFMSAAGESRANTVIDFENLTPTIETTLQTGSGYYWDGSDLTGAITADTTAYTTYTSNFTSGNITFDNTYTWWKTYQYGSWDGWSYSNVVDTTGVGFSNQYAAFAGGGADASSNYGIAYASPSSTITLATGTQIESIAVTNTTYAALSMRDGDFVVEKFGQNSHVDPELGEIVIDNYDDPDWCKLTITGKNASGSSVGIVDFYLADYQFPNNTQDYIVDTWDTIDLTSLSGATTLTFTMSSTDNSNYGMDNPAYFAIDNIMVSQVPEPASVAIIVTGLLAMLTWGRWRRGS